VLGYLPYDLKGNAGLNCIVSGYNNGEYPRGLGRTQLTKTVKELYHFYLGKKKQLIEKLKLQTIPFSIDNAFASRLFAAQQNCIPFKV
jgi:hypothetical protein